MLVIEGEGGVYLDLWHGECRGADYLEDSDARRARIPHIRREKTNGNVYSAARWTPSRRLSSDSSRWMATWSTSSSMSRRRRSSSNARRLCRHPQTSASPTCTASCAPQQATNTNPNGTSRRAGPYAQDVTARRRLVMSISSSSPNHRRARMPVHPSWIPIGRCNRAVPQGSHNYRSRN